MTHADLYEDLLKNFLEEKSPFLISLTSYF